MKEVGTTLAGCGEYETTVFVTCQFAAFHHWPDAPESHAFLRTMHRHMFHVKAWALVDHDNRDIEFIFLKERIETYCRGRLEGTQTSKSCEQFAKILLEAFKELFEVEVSEDGENGAIVRRLNEWF